MFKVVCSVDSSWHVVNSGGNDNQTFLSPQLNFKEEIL